jgi:hypothetical protein
MKKTCTKCKIEKEISEYHKDKSHKDGHKTHCKECENFYRKGRPQRKFTEERRIAQTIYRENNREKILFLQTRSRAKKKGIEINIQESDIIIPEICPVLGITLTYGEKYWIHASPSVDRVNCSKGYRMIARKPLFLDC